MFEYESWDIDWAKVLFWAAIILCIVGLFIQLMNKELAWNNGYCASCNVEYDLLNVYKGFEYYACPECKKIFSKPYRLY